MKISNVLITALAFVSLSGCCSKTSAEDKKKQEDKLAEALASAFAGAVSAPSPKVDVPPKATGPLTINIPKLGLKGLAPGETETPLMGDSEPIMIMASQFSVTVSTAKPTDPKKIKDAENASKLFKPKNSKSETLPDGWALTYENSGSAGANYFVNVRREIGGKGYLCETMQSTPEQQKLALAFCKSLSK